MSLYTWLNGAGGCVRSDRVDLSNPQCGINWRYTYGGPTFVNVNISETYDISQIKEYVLKLLDEKTNYLADDITTRVEEKMQNNIDLTVEAAINETFKEISEENLLSIIDEAKTETSHVG